MRIKWSFTFKNLSLLRPGMLCAKFGCGCMKLAQWFWRRRFFNLVNIFSIYCDIIFTWKRAGSSIGTKLISHQQKMLCAKFGWNQPNNLEFSLPQGCFEQNVVEIAPVVLEKRTKICNVYDDNADSDGQRTDCDQRSSLGSGELKWLAMFYTKKQSF